MANTEEKQEPIEDKLVKAKVAQQRIETTTDFNTYLITPIMPDITKSDYHKFVTKDTAVSFFPKSMGMKPVFLCLKYFQLLSDFVFIGCGDMALIYDAELKAFVNAMRSIEGFERTKLTEFGIVKTDKTGKNSSWFKGGGKGGGSE